MRTQHDLLFPSIDIQTSLKAQCRSNCSDEEPSGDHSSANKLQQCMEEFDEETDSATSSGSRVRSIKFPRPRTPGTKQFVVSLSIKQTAGTNSSCNFEMSMQFSTQSLTTSLSYFFCRQECFGFKSFLPSFQVSSRVFFLFMRCFVFISFICPPFM